MSERERIIELLESAESAVYWNSSDQGFIQKIADHLLANGIRMEPKQATSNENKRWIPVTERLPDEDGKFLVHRIIFGGVSTMSVVGFARNGKKVHEYDLRKKKNVWYEYDSEVGYYAIDTVTHWMPLPEPPKEENK